MSNYLDCFVPVILTLPQNYSTMINNIASVVTVWALVYMHIACTMPSMRSNPQLFLMHGTVTVMTTNLQAGFCVQNDGWLHVNSDE